MDTTEPTEEERLERSLHKFKRNTIITIACDVVAGLCFLSAYIVTDSIPFLVLGCLLPIIGILYFIVYKNNSEMLKQTSTASQTSE
ncbi:MAG: hypothetical protein LBO69_08680 [Ignavibacteria bacterium]|jgi:1,4-dihydroxy-2-naphthoate octaprenyltransferase|nr:hypothetical protein [Ignavibacteria bacterium]